MASRAKWAAVWSAVAILITFVLIVAAVDRYETQLTKINWPLVSLFCVFVFGGITVYRWNTNLARYNFIDMVMNQKTGKADPYRHLLFLFAGIAAWAIVQVVFAKEWATLTPLMTLVLGFFVAKPTVDGIADAWASRPAQSGAAGGGDQVNIVAPNAATVNTQPPAAEAATDDSALIGKAIKARKK